ncbi:MAG: redoxin domain-containing protein [Phycisphaerae bacterium]
MQIWKRVAVATTLSLATAAWAQDKGHEAAKPEKGNDTPKAAKAAAGDTKIDVGQPAPDFELTSADGKKVKLSDYKDKVVVLEWFNYECPVCKGAMPLMEQTSAKYAKKGVVWLAVDSTAVRKATENAEFAKNNKIVNPILMDNDGKVGHLYGAKTTPHMFVINKGTIAYMGAHDDKGKRNYIAEALDAVLDGKAPAVAKTQSYGCTIKYKKE